MITLYKRGHLLNTPLSGSVKESSLSMLPVSVTVGEHEAISSVC